MTAAVIPAWVHSVKKIKAELPREKMIMLGVGAAFSFLGMMFNIPMPGGTTGHAVGGTLIALLLGPESACIAVTIALLVQALLFGDCGVLAFGANCFNMAFVLPFVGFYTAKLIMRLLGGNRDPRLIDASELSADATPEQLRTRKLVAAGVGSYVGINAAALVAAVEFGIQPLLFTGANGQPLYCPYGLNIAVPAMMIGHLTIFGAAEVIFTVALYAFLTANEGTLSADAAEPGRAGTGFGSKKSLILIAVLIIATPLGLLAAGTAWGEWDVNDIPTMSENVSWNSLFPDYSMAGLPEWFGYILSAIIGVSILLIFFRILSAKSSKPTDYGNAE